MNPPSMSISRPKARYDNISRPVTACTFMQPIHRSISLCIAYLHSFYLCVMHLHVTVIIDNVILSKCMFVKCKGADLPTWRMFLEGHFA